MKHLFCLVLALFSSNAFAAEPAEALTVSATADCFLFQSDSADVRDRVHRALEEKILDLSFSSAEAPDCIPDDPDEDEAKESGHWFQLKKAEKATKGESYLSILAKGERITATLWIAVPSSSMT